MIRPIPDRPIKDDYDFINLKNKSLAICVLILKYELKALADKYGVITRVEGTTLYI